MTHPLLFLCVSLSVSVCVCVCVHACCAGYFGIVPVLAVKARGTNIRVHYKHCREIAAAICGMKLTAAIKYLKQVLAHERIIPFTVHTGGVGRHAQVRVDINFQPALHYAYHSRAASL